MPAIGMASIVSVRNTVAIVRTDVRSMVVWSVISEAYAETPGVIVRVRTPPVRRIVVRCRVVSGPMIRRCLRGLNHSCNDLIAYAGVGQGDNIPRPELEVGAGGPDHFYDHVITDLCPGHRDDIMLRQGE